MRPWAARARSAREIGFFVTSAAGAPATEDEENHARDDGGAGQTHADADADGGAGGKAAVTAAVGGVSGWRGAGGLARAGGFGGASCARGGRGGNGGRIIWEAKSARSGGEGQGGRDEPVAVGALAGPADSVATSKRLSFVASIVMKSPLVMLGFVSQAPDIVFMTAFVNKVFRCGRKRDFLQLAKMTVPVRFFRHDAQSGA